jgi:radical SAM protein with 4Fe4S-binding SPASM domain
MSEREVKRIIDIFREKAKIPFFSFTGGEPALREDLPALIRYGKKRGFRVNLITNGTLLTEKLCARLKSSGLDSVQVSLEAPDAETHDYLTQVKGSHARALEGMKALMAAGIPVQTNTTLNRHNAGAAPAMPSFLDGLGVRRFSMNLFIPQAGARPGGKDPASLAAEELFLPYAEVGALVDRVRKEAFKPGLAFFWYSPTPFCLYNPVARGLGNKNCAAMDGLISVCPSGEVLPCSSYPEPMGSLLSEPFEEVWFSARARHFKEKRYAPDECSLCPSFKACQSACPLYWEYAGLSELAGRNPARSEAS